MNKLLDKLSKDTYTSKLSKRMRIFDYSVFLACMAMIVLFPLPRLNKGVNLTDSTFKLINFKYFFTDYNISIFGFSGTDFVGGILFALTDSHQLLVLNVAKYLCALIIIFLVVLLCRRFSPLSLIGVSLLISYFWTLRFPCSLHYNDLSQLVFVLSVLLLFLSLQNCNHGTVLAILALSLLAFAIFVRFPNILFLSVLLPYLYCYYLSTKCLKSLLRRFLVIATAGITSLVIWGALLSYFIGFSRMRESLVSLIGMTLDGGGYSFSWFVRAPYLALTGQITSEIQMVAIVLLTALIVLVITLFLTKRAEYQFFFLVSAALTLMLCLPFGSNNGVYTFLNFSFLIAAVSASAFWQLANNSDRVSISSPLLTRVIRTGIIAVGLPSIVLSSLVAYSFSSLVYGDDPIDNLVFTLRTPEFQGMYTSERNYLHERTYLEAKRLFPGHRTIDINHNSIAGALVFNTPPFFSQAWVGLDLITLEQMENQLSERFDPNDETTYPIIFMNVGAREDPPNQKVVLISDFMDDNDYVLIASDGHLVAYGPPVSAMIKSD